MKCIFVIGPESSGSMLIAKTISHALNIHEFGDWDGIGWSEKGEHRVCHRSLPYSSKSVFPDVGEWIKEYAITHDLYFVLTTRDIAVSELSRFRRWAKPSEQSRTESDQARKIMLDVLAGDQPALIWSYESFMYLGKPYLDLLYDFIGVESGFMPEIYDANRSKIKRPHIGDRIYGKLRTIGQAVRANR